MLKPRHEARQKRRRTLLAGQIILNSGEVVIDCTVKNLSDGGALLSLAGSVMLPESFQLRIPSRNAFVTGRLAWRSGLEVGMQFLGGDKVAPRRSSAILSQSSSLRSRLEAYLSDVDLTVEEFLSGALALIATCAILAVAFMS
jgi:hypothetical protein